MTDFKHGQRVRYSGGHTSYNDPGCIGATGTVVADLDSNGVEVDWDKDLGVRSPSSVVFPENLEIVDVEPKVGDRVRVTHEGVVTAVTGTGSGRAVVIDGEARLLGKGETVEVLERAPKAYAPGTVAVFKNYHDIPIIRDHAVWRTRGGTEAISTDRDIAAGGDWRVVYEPATA